MSSTSVGMSNLSDEILLCILRHVPVCDLLLNVANVCHKLHTLCHDKTLLTNVSLSEEYMVKLLKKNFLSSFVLKRHVSELLVTMINFIKFICVEDMYV